MNKTIKMLSVLIVTIMLFCTFTQTCFANGVDVSDFENAGYSSTKTVKIQEKAKKLLSAIRNISVIVAIIVVSYLGIKYMIGSTEEKASYKKAFIPLIVGVILVVAAAQIATMLFSIGTVK